MESEPGISRRITLGSMVALLAIVILACGLRWWRMGHLSFFLDELWHVELAMGNGEVHNTFLFDHLYTALPDATSLEKAGSVWAISSQIHNLTHPPLFLILLRFWCEVFGTGDIATRSFSAFASVLGVVVFFDLVRRINGTSAACWSAAIMAVAGPQLQLSQEVRQYTLAVLFCLLAAHSLVIALQSGPTLPRQLLLGGFCVLAMLTHYFCLPVLLAFGLYAMLRCKPGDHTRIIIVFVCAAVVFGAIWGSKLLKQSDIIHQNADPYLIDSQPLGFLKLFWRTMQVPVQTLLLVDEKSRPITRLGGVLLLLPLFLVRKRPELLLWVIWLGTFVVFFVALDTSRNTLLLGYTRYLSLCGPPVYALIATLVNSPAWMRHVLPALVVLGGLMSYPELFDFEKPEYREVAHEIDKGMTGKTAVVVVNTPDIPYYSRFTMLALTRYCQTYPYPIAMVEGPPRDPLKGELDRFDTIWIASHFIIRNPPEFLPGWHGVNSYYFGHAAILTRLEKDSSFAPAMQPADARTISPRHLTAPPPQ